ncbi:MmcQ/YjbR family DNA-binding protein [Nocardiopsis sp. B62]|uniref:MmcQ/YjbR family DNA-binding protein n=1 Tax=Nocardiopsis sp. B62 TaxID=2824874 RepID=UPI001B37E4EB|nr:MmcQ/YjbR family DNA-binding protein [Nocardiopsis sp. B62]MBQ1079871.1 MmcQ/YjbR family DNA-binding protein [Nocardiopsis sp. B62]
MSGEDDVRRIALALPEVTERPCYGRPAFYASGRIFARLHDMPDVLVLWLSSAEHGQELRDAGPERFFTTDHYQGHASVLVRLGLVEVTELSELLDEAWRLRAPRRLTGPGPDTRG